jgi:hypothetical protein
MTQNNLGIAYRKLLAGNRDENLRNAIQCHKDALQVYTESDFPAEFAMVLGNLSIAYQSLPTGDRALNLRNAIQCFESALRGFRVANLENDVSEVETRIALLKTELGD